MRNQDDHRCLSLMPDIPPWRTTPRNSSGFPGPIEKLSLLSACILNNWPLLLLLRSRGSGYILALALKEPLQIKSPRGERGERETAKGAIYWGNKCIREQVREKATFWGGKSECRREGKEGECIPEGGGEGNVWYWYVRNRQFLALGDVVLFYSHRTCLEECSVTDSICRFGGAEPNVRCSVHYFR